MSDGGDCRTAPATLGLLKTVFETNKVKKIKKIKKYHMEHLQLDLVYV